MEDLQAVRAELSKLQEQRAAIEAEINQRAARLNAPGQPGMQGSLLDKEGFPRADIDVHAVRIDRNAVIRLGNDHKAISRDMEVQLHRLHELAREAGVTSLNGSSSGGGQPAAPPTPTPPAAPAAAAAGPAGERHEDKRPRLGDSAGPEPPPPAAAAAGPGAAAATAAAGAGAPPLRPFAVVDEVSEGSPAAAAGIQLGDQLCRFGSAEAGDSSSSSSSALQAVAAELQAHEGRPVAAVFLRAGQPMTLSLTPRPWAGRGLLGCHLRPL